MRYFLQAVETESGFPFEQQVRDRADYEKLKQSLEAEGYSDFGLDERWDSLDEMHAYVAERQQ